MEKYVPDIYQKSIYNIDYNKLKSNGIKCLLFDLDNTIVPYSIKNATQKNKELFESLKEKKFKIIIYTDTFKRRAKRIAGELQVDFLSMTRKPGTKKIFKIMNDFRLEPSEICIIGDQLLTDVLAGNKAGITTILVNPVSVKDNFFIRLISRRLEKRVLKKLRKLDLFEKGKYYE